MKKKILLLAFALMLFAGVVSASSINGDYKGNPIVTVTSNGKLLETDEVPAQIYDGHTVVPISLLRQLGASVTWDAYAYNVEIKLPQGSLNKEETSKTSIDEIYNALGPSGNNSILSVDYGIFKDISQISFYLNFIGSDKARYADYENIMNYGYYSGAKQIKIEDNSATNFINVDDIRDLNNGKITIDEYYARLRTTFKNQSPSNQTPNNQTPQKPIQPVNNNPNVQDGDNTNFQFIGVNDFFDKSGYLHVAGQIKNIMNIKTSGAVHVTVTLFDFNGNVVAVQDGYANGFSSLNSGETTSFEIIFYGDTTKYSRFNVKVKS